MTAYPERGSEENLKPIPRTLSSGVTAFWATTYSVDLHLFNEYLLPRLGDPPLNVVVLADTIGSVACCNAYRPSKPTHLPR